MELNKIYQGDCLELGHEIEPGSVDLILTDLPYGNMKNAPSTWDAQKTRWDITIAPEDIHGLANRILRKNGRMILFSQEPYTTQLINGANSNVPFSYRAIWEKDTFANALGVNKSMVGMYEDVLIFSKFVEDKTGHVLQEYFYEEFKKTGLSVREVCNALGTTNASHFFTKGKQFRVPNERYLKMLQDLTGRFDITHKEIVRAQEEYREKYPSTFNLWEGEKYKSNILKYKKDYNGYHPTQKPLLLLEDLIKTFSNDGDLVVDLTCGSGSTCVAAQKTGRSFIGIEKEKEYVDIANERIKQSQLMFEMG